MKLEWMGPYRPLVEAYIKSANHYARSYQQPTICFEDVALSPALVQVLEYILENEEQGLSMQALADRLGITRSAFSKMVAKLAAQGLLEKRHPAGNAKEYRLQATPKGRRIYQSYVDEVFALLFGEVFALAHQIPAEYADIFAQILNRLAG
jgi:DNA-binding MarR family transcriptional regulator